MQGAISNERANDIKFEEEAKEKNRDDQHSTLSDEENGSNGDSAIQMPYVKTPEEKRLLRKISYTFLPLVTWIVMVQVQDIAFAFCPRTPHVCFEFLLVCRQVCAQYLGRTRYLRGHRHKWLPI